MNRFTLRQLQIFVAVAESQNLAAAGRAQRLSPATMSEALRTLEAGLRRPLFDRSNRRLLLNPAGHAFLKDVRALLNQSQELQRRHGAGARLLCGASVTVGNYILPPTIVKLAKARPDLRVDVVIRNTDSIAQMLLDRKIQAAVVEGSIAHSLLEVIPWREDALAIIASPDHPLAAGAGPVELAGARWILREPGSGTRESFDAFAASWPGPAEVIIEAGGNELIKQAVGAGLGLGCLAKAAVSAEIGRGELVEISLGVPLLRTLTFVRRVGDVEDDSLAALMTALGV